MPAGVALHNSRPPFGGLGGESLYPILAHLFSPAPTASLLHTSLREAPGPDTFLRCSFSTLAWLYWLQFGLTRAGRVCPICFKSYCA